MRRDTEDEDSGHKMDATVMAMFGAAENIPAKSRRAMIRARHKNWTSYGPEAFGTTSTTRIVYVTVSD